jgi:hypothetical protein
LVGNRVLRRIFGPKRDEVTRGWGILHNEEINILYPSPNLTTRVKFKEGEMGEVCNTHRETINAYKTLVRKPE